ncbi:phage baseplate assembly protein V [Neisseria meningitidis]|uniref:phage baseplate assembly protein V n=1 Tax=Neisseria meningitidis TaxID=487 RepID=UPI000FCBD1E7|nr:phage baseplate assembly protein V [Neisseria meningitidis]
MFLKRSKAVQTHDFTATMQFGTVSAVDAAAHSLRVKIPVLDDMETDWLPMATPAAGGNRFYSLPDVGELVVCLLDARGEAGCVIGAIYNATDKPPVSDQNKWVKQFTNGTVISHDRGSGEVVVETPGKVKIKAAQKVDIQSSETEITGNATVNGLLTYTAGLVAGNVGGGEAAKITGNVIIDGELIVNGINIGKHIHDGDSGGQTGEPKNH